MQPRLWQAPVLITTPSLVVAVIEILAAGKGVKFTQGQAMKTQSGSRVVAFLFP
jgi:hypothetical protein